MKRGIPSYITCLFIASCAVAMAALAIGAQNIYAHDFTQNDLPPNYSGDNIVEIYNDIQSNMPKKDEFETTEQFNARFAKELKRYAGKEFSFIFSHPNQFSYDADKKIVTVRIPGNSIKYESIKQLLFFIVVNYKIESANYVATNAFGAKKEITVSKSDVFGVAPINLKDIPKSLRHGKEYAISFLAPPEEAKELKDSLGVVIVTKLAPLVGKLNCYGVTGINPTMDIPLDITWYNHVLFGSIQSILVVNRKTGKIYSRLSFTPDKFNKR